MKTDVREQPEHSFEESKLAGENHLEAKRTTSTSVEERTIGLLEDEGRDDWGEKESNGVRDPPPKKSTPTKRTQRKPIGSPRQQRRPPYDPGYQYSKGYPPPGRPYPPPPYSYDPHYRPPPPPPHHHYAQMPPIHPVQGYPYPPPPNYHPYGSHPYQSAHMQYPPPPHPMPSSYPHAGPSPSDNASISSTKSRGSTTKNSKYKGSSRKKRTIDGVHQEPYTFGRSNSNTSTSSVGNNTSNDTPQLNDESPQKRQFPSSTFFDDDKQLRRSHRRDCSGASTASSLSVGALSMSSYEAREGAPLTRASPKRRRGHNSIPIPMDSTDALSSSSSKRHDKSALAHENDVEAAPERFQKLSVQERSQEQDSSTSIFLSLSTSPINSNSDVEATPISKNMKKSAFNNKGVESKGTSGRPNPAKEQSKDHDTSMSPVSSMIDRNADTPTPPLPGTSTDNEVLTDEHLLNRHLRGQSFTPLPHMGQDGRESRNGSPTSNNHSFPSIQPQLSWSIAGDALSLGDLAEWEEDRQKTEQKRPESTTSQNSNGTRGMVLSPNSFSMWRDEDMVQHGRTESKDNESLRLSTLSPNSDIAMGEAGAGGATTPLPFFFSEEERENAVGRTFSNNSDKSVKEIHGGERLFHPYQAAPDNAHSIFVNRGSGSKRGHKSRWQGGVHHSHIVRNDSGQRVRLPPTPVYSDHRDDAFARGHHDRRDTPEYFSPYGMHPPSVHGPPTTDRVRNLRGRAPPHHAPMPLQVPPMNSHHTLTSPMGMPGKGGMWGGMHHHPNPHHHLPSPLELNPSKRKCVPLKPPIPSKFQGDIEKMKTAQVPEFTSLVNFPAHMSQKQSVNLPDGMRCCVMCGQACPCSTGNKNKKGSSKNKDGNARGHDQLGDKQAGFAIIPTQNKGLCTLCDVNVWVVCQNGLEIKWCKGCKNFRPWAAFGDKGLATKCLRCRERQREKYALQKEEKEKARLLAKNSTKTK